MKTTRQRLTIAIASCLVMACSGSEVRLMPGDSPAAALPASGDRAFVQADGAMDISRANPMPVGIVSWNTFAQVVGR